MGSFTQPFVNLAAWDGIDLFEVPPLPVANPERYFPYTSTVWRNQWIVVVNLSESPHYEYLLAYNGTAWSVMAESSGIYNLLVGGADNLLAIGDFAMYINDVRFACTAVFDGVAWSEFGGGCSSQPRWYYAGFAGDRIAIGADYGLASGYTAVWNGTAWVEELHTYNGQTYQGVYHNGLTYISGTFTEFAGAPASNVGAFSAEDGVARAVPGLNFPPVALLSDGDRLLAGGEFRFDADGVYVGPVAAFNGDAWKPAWFGLSEQATRVIAFAQF